MSWSRNPRPRVEVEGWRGWEERFGSLYDEARGPASPRPRPSMQQVRHPADSHYEPPPTIFDDDLPFHPQFLFMEFDDQPPPHHVFVTTTTGGQDASTRGHLLRLEAGCWDVPTTLCRQVETVVRYKPSRRRPGRLCLACAELV